MSTRNVRALIARFRDEGRCILISTHLMDETQRTCDRVAITLSASFFQDAFSGHSREFLSHS
jgi:ABC-type Na+ transport system ATPase subunit NatA